MPVRLDEPAKAYRRIVEKILLPEVAYVELDASDHKADDRQWSPLELGGRADWNRRRRISAHKRLKVTEPSLIDIEQRCAVRTRHALRAVGRSKLKRAAAVRAVELRRSDLLRFALARASRTGE